MVLLNQWDQNMSKKVMIGRREIKVDLKEGEENILMEQNDCWRQGWRCQ